MTEQKTYGTIQMIAWGMTEGPVGDEVIHQVQREARATGYIIRKSNAKDRRHLSSLSFGDMGSYTLLGPEVEKKRKLNHTKKEGASRRRYHIARGNLRVVCEVVVAMLEPEHYPEELRVLRNQVGIYWPDVPGYPNTIAPIQEAP